MIVQSIADEKLHEVHIDGLRGLAALMVLAVHLEIGKFSSSFLRSFVDAGARGVQLFFLISAYTLFRSSKLKFHRDKYPRRNFFLRRAFRILPLWWISLIIFALIDGRSFHDCLPDFFMYFGFIRYIPGTDVIPLGWSIFVEETFYLFLPVIFAVVTNFRRATAFCLVMITVCAVWIKGGRRIGIPEDVYFLSLAPPAQWPALAGGICLYFLLESPTVKFFINHKWGNRVLQGVTLVAFLAFFRSNFLVATVSVALLFVSAASTHGFMARLARWKLLRSFGVCCYSIYLFHPLVVRWSAPLFQKLFLKWSSEPISGELQFLVIFPLTAFLCLLIGQVIFKWIEYPSVQLGKKLIRKTELAV